MIFNHCAFFIFLINSFFTVNNFFKFSNKQSRGFAIVVLLSMLLVVMSQIINKQYIEYSDFQDVDTVVVATYALQKSLPYTYRRSNESTVRHFNFNPNTISLEQWAALGIKKQVGIRIKKYLSKGGEFKVKSDLGKIYGLSSKDFSLLKPYILLPDTLQKTVLTHANQTKKIPLPEIQDINTIDVERLDKFPGIGEVLAARIVKYRNKVGGFFDLTQLLEVYGVQEAVYLKMIPLLTVNKNDLVKMDINRISIADLGAHPYVGYKNATLIVNYRIQHGFFHSMNDVLRIKELDQSKLYKADNYFIFEYSN